MADRKITSNTALTGAGLAATDVFQVVDVSDTTDGATGTNKKMVATEQAIGVIAQVASGGIPMAKLATDPLNRANHTGTETAGGDLSGTLPSPTVAKINGIAVTGTPSTGQVPTATGTTAATWQTPTAATPEIGDWTDAGNLGASVTFTGAANTVLRRKGTLNANTAITLTTSANQQIDLELVQDGTGARNPTWVNVNVWSTQSGSAPSLAGRAASAVDRFYFENIGGTVYGYWLTETIAAPALSVLRPSSSVGESYSRAGASITNVTLSASGTLVLIGVPYTAGQVVTTITFVTGSTALASGSNQHFSLWDSARAKLAVTSDDTSTAWAANTAKTLTLTAPYTIPTTGLYYHGILLVASTMPTLAGVVLGCIGTLQIAPPTFGASSTGLTNPASLPSTAAAITNSSNYPWTYAS